MKKAVPYKVGNYELSDSEIMQRLAELRSERDLTKPIEPRIRPKRKLASISNMITAHKASKGESLYWIYLPNLELDMKTGGAWARMPDDVYLHKLYPTCKCGRKYIPRPEGECFYCSFTKK